MTKNKKISASNIFTGILIAFTIAMLLIPSFKGTVMQGLMKVGLFQPSIPDLPKEQVITEFASNNEEARVSFENKDGESIQIGSLRGKVVFINFWATWCPPCIAEMPSIQKLYSEFKNHKNVVFMMVDVDNKRERSQKFMDRRKFDLPIYTPASSIPSSYFTGSIPTTLVLNRYGEVVFKHEGMGDFSNQDFKDFIKELATL